MKTIANTERRRSRRYLPPPGFRLVIRRAGFLSFLTSDLFRTCLNVSEGGLRVVLNRGVALGDLLRIRLDLGRGADPVDLIAQVTYAVTSGAHPDCWEAGLRFQDVAPDDQTRLREALLARGTPLNPATRRWAKTDPWGSAH